MPAGGMLAEGAMSSATSPWFENSTLNYRRSRVPFQGTKWDLAFCLLFFLLRAPIRSRSSQHVVLGLLPGERCHSAAQATSLQVRVFEMETRVAPGHS